MLFIVCGVTRLRQKVFAGMKMDPMGGMGKKKCARACIGPGSSKRVEQVRITKKATASAPAAPAFFGRNVALIQLHLLEMSHEYSYTC